LSGIAGIFNRNGKPVDRALLQALTHFLRYRGPDARETWSFGAVGLGHAMVRTTRESLNERQPVGVDGRFWITADARIDYRTELGAKLEGAGRKPSRTASDAELILHAYAAWGSDCVQYLRGDFSFAIWDIRERQLFCARDHFGVKPFYYAEAGGTFIFSNTLNSVRMHPLTTDELNDAAILDFLLIGMNWNDATTTFRDVLRLPPAHSLTISADELRLRGYWKPPIDGRIRHRDEAEYLEHFRSLLNQAVHERMRTDRVGIFLSGGLDSSSIAATARRVTGNSERAELRAFTTVCESLAPDIERRFALKVAEHLQIPIRFQNLKRSEPFRRTDVNESAWPEPIAEPFFADVLDGFRMIEANCRVALNGEGNDALMSFQMTPYARDLWRKREWRRLLHEMVRFVRVRRVPARGAAAWAQKLFGKGPLVGVLPNWISPDLAQPRRVRERWEEINGRSGSRKHPIVPTAHASLELPTWAQFFESNDPGVTHCPVEVRYPFFDLRIVEFLLAIPPFPWFYEKMLLRSAMAGRLPEEILMRPKTPMATDPLVAQVRACDETALDPMNWVPEMDRFVDRAAMPKLAGEDLEEKVRIGVRPHCLNFWLQFSRGVRYNLVAEAGNG